MQFKGLYIVFAEYNEMNLVFNCVALIQYTQVYTKLSNINVNIWTKDKMRKLDLI